MATKTKASKAPVEVEADDDEDIELEELDAEVEEEAPKAKKGKTAKKSSRADDPAFGIRQLCDLLEERTGKAYQPREVRTLLRKMARDESGRVTREVAADNRSRYSWTGAEDPEVKAILKAVKGGEIEAGKKEALDKLKESKAKKAVAPETAKPAKKKAKVVEPDDDDIELDDDDD